MSDQPPNNLQHHQQQAHQCPNQRSRSSGQNPHMEPFSPEYARFPQPRQGVRCAECGKIGHSNQDCCSIVDVEGFMLTCPKCNPGDKHSWDDCPLPKLPGDEKFYLLILRHGKPAVKIGKDIRDIEGFHETTCTPMTPNFAKSSRNSKFPQYDHYRGNWRNDRRYPGRDWQTPAKLPPLGELIHPEMKQRNAQRGEPISFIKNERADIVNTRANQPIQSNTRPFPSSTSMKRSLKLEDDSAENPMEVDSGLSTKKLKLKETVQQMWDMQQEINKLEDLENRIAALDAKVAEKKRKDEEDLEELAKFLSQST